MYSVRNVNCNNFNADNKFGIHPYLLPTALNARGGKTERHYFTHPKNPGGIFTHLKKPEIYGFFWVLLRFCIRKINFLTDNT